MSKKEIVSTFFSAAFDQNAEVMRELADQYIQHNPFIPTGLDNFIQTLPLLQEDGITFEPLRMFEDGNYIFLHSSWKNAQVFGANEMISFDILRLNENEKIVEHWDAFTPMVSQTASGRSQIDGPTSAMDWGKTSENKRLVRAFLEEIVMEENSVKAEDYISDTQYHEHNPLLKDGLNGIKEFIEHYIPQNNIKYNKIHKVLGEGNFVLAISEGESNGKPQAFYDLFRLDGGQLVEHWDVSQEIPTEGVANDNGMFGFS